METKNLSCTQGLGEKGTVYTGQTPVYCKVNMKRQPSTLTFTPGDNLKSPINPMHMFFDCRRKPAYPEKTNAGTERTCKFYKERPRLALNL